jgi:hypothetical protein
MKFITSVAIRCQSEWETKFEETEVAKAMGEMANCVGQVTSPPWFHCHLSLGLGREPKFTQRFQGLGERLVDATLRVDVT